MTKAERLIYLVNMIKNRGSVLVKDMAAECGVSDRTIYRDLNSLSRMNIPVYYQNGYRLMRDTDVPFMDLSLEDMQLIRYCLRNNPLYGDPFFKGRFRIIDQKMLEKEKAHKKNGEGDFFIFDARTEPMEQKRGTEILSRFLMAVFERRKIAVRAGADNNPETVYVPLAVRVRGNRPILILADNNKLSAVELDVDDIHDMRLTAETFDRRPTQLVAVETTHKNG
ncbi:MAG: DeoR family transcriptional regulator [candidate division Zixibacteria bacterium]|nr:DeoR family transcriptional regulator [candidate division Zixibacteria bacterium]